MTEILILLSVWIMGCAICAAAGFQIGKNYKKSPPKSELPEPDAREVNKAKKAILEYENFLNYDGSEQK